MKISLTGCSRSCDRRVLVLMAESQPSPVFGSPAPVAVPQARLRALNRSQWRMLNIDVDRLIPDDHAARAIWDLVGRLDLCAFYETERRWKGIRASRRLIRG